jgi:hypothetical protein
MKQRLDARLDPGQKVSLRKAINMQLRVAIALRTDQVIE